MTAELDMKRIPEHIAIIMDGNGRWAMDRGLDRTFGHKAGRGHRKERLPPSVRA